MSTTQTSVETFTPQLGITVTDAAIAHIQRELAKADDASVFRLYLETSGCSGYMYETELVSAPQQEDTVFTVGDDGLKVCVPNKDLPLLNGTVVDFIKVGLNSMFQFRNPNVTGECGCGESFTVNEE
ncbi:MAG: iron-sulfur cluster assembly accessory protein [Oleiphilaceae bacterium]|nr:iron-sulfur cluster assembly accessory protein [Oleiphilaceae bacterium]